MIITKRDHHEIDRLKVWSPSQEKIEGITDELFWILLLPSLMEKKFDKFFSRIERLKIRTITISYILILCMR